MDRDTLKELLGRVQSGRVSLEEAVEQLRRWPFEAMEFATLDHHRAIRCGFPEVIYCPGKSVEQVGRIFARLADAGPTVLATRATLEQYDAVAADLPAAEYNQVARTITLRRGEHTESVGHVAVLAAGTSDLPVAEEARVTAEIMDARVTTHYDVGVAGLHRLLACRETLELANAIVVVAGMEGALPSVVGGLVAVSVIAVPTSVGYGASFSGIAALLGMLNSCAPGVSVVNIDNGFAGGYIAATINKQAANKK
ncbi:MAG: nickel pincer cofactor biosynthesis protein LarB [Phycisphaerae bacterium]|jgi:hypothetical protein|nr:nickel pincer cofactor biosynthesis protein LarB [Phycisphaerae bacterium]